MKILIAEDEPTLRENLQWMLEMEGYEVLSAFDGVDALEQCLAHQPDLLISDVMMPRLDGYELVKILRENVNLATLPIIMLTAKADRGDVRIGMNMGADDYLIKPYRREELLEAITVRLNRSVRQSNTAQKQQHEIKLALQRDPLTGLANRHGFEEALNRTLQQCDEPTSRLVLCLGLDGFSKINDSYGSEVGNAVLLEVGRRLCTSIEHIGNVDMCDSVARLGDDRFGISFSTPPTNELLKQSIERLLTTIKQPMVVQTHSLHLSASAGACCATPGCTATHLLLNAESALHQAKQTGPGSINLFDISLSQQVIRRMHIHNELHEAVANDQLQVYYQPQVNIHTGELRGFEALARWQHPTLGWVSPAEFIAVAEESGIIVELGARVLRTAAKQAALWLAQGHTGFRMAVNLSVRQFADERLPELVAQTLHDTGLPAHMLELEVTESLALQSIATTLGTLHALKRLGIKLSMDDFGTGYSSLAYLKRYPLDTLKVDQSFVRNITHDKGDAAITQTVVAMAHSFGLNVIAEGVETPEQLAFLRQIGCEEFQGYLFSRPVPASEAVACFAGHHPAPGASA
jgi:diguanylate cyclase (GGDEF)-like protein